MLRASRHSRARLAAPELAQFWCARGLGSCGAQNIVLAALQTVQPCVCRGSQGDRSKANSAPRPGREGYTTALLLEAGNVLLRKCYDVYPCTRLALQARHPGMR